MSGIGPIDPAPFAVGLAPHWIALPVLLPLAAGALAAGVGGVSAALSRTIGLIAALAHLGASIVIFMLAQDGQVRVYEMGNWPAPFGIVLVLDQLSALMVLLTSAMALIGLSYANGAWEGRGRRFQALWQFQLFGLSGAFLTGDLFNLFVFFEVLLAAAYGLLLHGGGRARTGATFHYIAINLAASGVFLLAVGLLYVVTGTLNMAHIAQAIAVLPPQDVGLAAVAGMLLLTVFLVKSGLAPFHFWLPASYGSAAAPVVVLIAAKVGAYAILRVFPLLFGDGLHAVDGPASSLAGLAQPWMLVLALATLVVGAAGTLASTTLRQLAATLTLVSIGTLFLPLAAGGAPALAAGLFYLLHTTIAAGLLFLVAEWAGTNRGPRGDRLAPGEPLAHPFLIGAALVWAMATSVGLPPTSGFVAKVLVLESIADAPQAAWMWAAILLSSFCSLVAMARALSVILWNHAPNPAWVSAKPAERPILISEQEHLVPLTAGSSARIGVGVAATVAILGLGVALVLAAGSVRAHTERLAAQMLDPAGYQQAVLGGRTRALEPLLRPSPMRGTEP